jgi:hypothetical protein
MINDFCSATPSPLYLAMGDVFSQQGGWRWISGMHIWAKREKRYYLYIRYCGEGEHLVLPLFSVEPAIAVRRSNAEEWIPYLGNPATWGCIYHLAEEHPGIREEVIRYFNENRRDNE